MGGAASDLVSGLGQAFGMPDFRNAAELFAESRFIGDHISGKAMLRDRAVYEFFTEMIRT